MALTASDVRLRIPLTPEALDRLKDRPILRNRAMKARPAILAPGAPFDNPDPTVSFHIWLDVNRSVKTWMGYVIQDWNDLFGKEVLHPAGEGEKIDLAIGTKPFDFGESRFESAPIGMLLPHNPKPYSVPQDEYGDCTLYWDDLLVRRQGEILIADDLGKLDTKCALAHELGHFFLLGHVPDLYRLMHHSLNGVYLPKPKEIEWIREINGFNW